MNTNLKDVEKLLKGLTLPAVPTEKTEAITREAAGKTNVKSSNAVVKAYLGELEKRMNTNNAEALDRVRKELAGISPDAGLLNQGRAMDSDTKVLLQRAFDEIEDPLLNQARNDLSSKLTELHRRQNALSVFQNTHKLNRPCAFPNKALAIFIKVSMAAAESKINSVIITPLTAYGGSEALVLALIISGVNITLGSIGGTFLKGIRHVDAKERQAGWVKSIVIFTVQFSFAYLITLMISGAETGGFDSSMALNTIFTGDAAFLPWELSFDALRLLGVTILFGVVSAWMAYSGKLSEKYPGYSEVAAPVRDAQKELTAEINQLEDKFAKPVVPQLPDLSIQTEEREKNLRLLNGAQAAITAYSNALDAVLESNSQVVADAVTYIENRADVIFSNRKGKLTLPQMTLPINPMHQDLKDVQAAYTAQKKALEDFQGTLNALKAEMQSRIQAERRGFIQACRAKLNGLDAIESDERTVPASSRKKSRNGRQSKVTYMSDFWKGDE